MSIPTTAYVAPLRWVDREYMTELKLDAQQGNAKFLRDQRRNRPFYTSAGVHAYEYDTGGGQLVGTEQFRIRARPSALGSIFVTDHATARLGLPVAIQEEDWTTVSAVNHNWAPGASTDQSFDVRFDWRPDSNGTWALLGVHTFYGVGFSDEVNDYASLWSDLVVYGNSRRWEVGHNGWVVVVVRGLTLLGGRLNEAFGGGGAP